MPRTLTLVRHGESESNAAKRAAERGKPFAAEAKLMGVHTSERRLTPKGVEQAQQAGAWLRENWLQFPYEKRCYVSPYVRAAETAGFTGLNQEWRVDNRLCERNWGSLDQMTHEERMRVFKEQLARRKKHAFFWRPADGETLQDVFNRIRDLIGTLHRECERMHVLAVCHGETMLAWRTVLEYWLPQDLRNDMSSKDKRFDILNCRIIQYSRQDENNELHLHEKFVRVRFVDPTDPENPTTNHDWMPVKRRLWSEADLQTFLEAS